MKRSGKYGVFFSCRSFPQCKFAFNPELDNQRELNCPKCGKSLEIKERRYGKFVGCTGYPECRYTFDLRKHD